MKEVKEKRINLIKGKFILIGNGNRVIQLRIRCTCKDGSLANIAKIKYSTSSLNYLRTSRIEARSLFGRPWLSTGCNAKGFLLIQIAKHIGTKSHLRDSTHVQEPRASLHK